MNALKSKNRFKQFNLRDRINKTAITEFEQTYETLAQFPCIVNGWIARSPSNSDNRHDSISTSSSDAVYVIWSQTNLRQVWFRYSTKKLTQKH